MWRSLTKFVNDGLGLLNNVSLVQFAKLMTTMMRVDFDSFTVGIAISPRVLRSNNYAAIEVVALTLGFVVPNSSAGAAHADTPLVSGVFRCARRGAAAPQLFGPGSSLAGCGKTS
jgi:hypothetical protein